MNTQLLPTRFFTNLIVLMILFSLIVSCQSENKESYLKNYKEFIDEVSRKESDYSPSQWKIQDKKHKAFSSRWHEELDEFNTKERVQLIKYEIIYLYYRTEINVSEIFWQLRKIIPLPKIF